MQQLSFVLSAVHTKKGGTPPPPRPVPKGEVGSQWTTAGAVNDHAWDVVGDMHTLHHMGG